MVITIKKLMKSKKAELIEGLTTTGAIIMITTITIIILLVIGAIKCNGIMCLL